MNKLTYFYISLTSFMMFVLGIQAMLLVCVIAITFYLLS